MYHACSIKIQGVKDCATICLCVHLNYLLACPPKWGDLSELFQAGFEYCEVDVLPLVQLRVNASLLVSQEVGSDVLEGKLILSLA